MTPSQAIEALKGTLRDVIRERDDFQERYARLLSAVEPLLAAAEKATPGEWEVVAGAWGVFDVVTTEDRKVAYLAEQNTDPAHPLRRRKEAKANAAFIVTARNAASALRDLLGPTGGEA